MVYAPESGRSQSFFARSIEPALFPDLPDGEPGGIPFRSLGKRILVVGLAALSGGAAYIGILELMQAGARDVPLAHKAIAGIWVALLTLATLWLLSRTAATANPMARTASLAAALLLGVISSALGFGFYWKVLHDGAEAVYTADPAVTAVKAALGSASARYDDLNGILARLAADPGSTAATSRSTQCPGSEEDAAFFAFASQFVAGRTRVVRLNIAALESPTAVAGSGRRAEAAQVLTRRLGVTAASFNALQAEPQFRKLRQDLAARTAPAPVTGSRAAACLPPRAAQDLREALRAIDGLPPLTAPAAAHVAGSDATAMAFHRLAASLDSLLAVGLPSSVAGLRILQQAVQPAADARAIAGAVTESTGLTDHDYLPLALATLVNMALVLLFIGRPREDVAAAWAPPTQPDRVVHRGAMHQTARAPFPSEPRFEPRFAREAAGVMAAAPRRTATRASETHAAPRHRYPGTSPQRAADVFGPYAQSADAELNTGPEQETPRPAQRRTDTPTGLGEPHTRRPGVTAADVEPERKKNNREPGAGKPPRIVATPPPLPKTETVAPTDTKPAEQVSQESSCGFSDDGAAAMASRLRPARRSA